MLCVFFPFRFQSGNKVFFICGYSLFHFFPSRWAVLVSDSYYFVDDFIYSLLVFACDLYSCLFENFFQMSEVTGHVVHREQLMKFRLLWFWIKIMAISDHYLCSLLPLHKLLPIVRKKRRLWLTLRHVACSAYFSLF